MKSWFEFTYSDKTAIIVQYLERKEREIFEHKDKNRKQRNIKWRKSWNYLLR